MKYLRIKPFVSGTALLVLSALLVGFCVFTNIEGFHRRYVDADIPLVYRLNNTTPAAWAPVIKEAADNWTNLDASYWEFEEGDQTSATDVNRDNINLVFFDVQGVNFSTGSGVIAFSASFEEGTGANFRVVESDLVWNARDFPPSITGAPGQQDMEGIMSHEFGHHMGIGHAGPIGSPPGCGPLLNASSTMYCCGTAGDTTHRSLEPDDIAAAAAIYPTWVMQGSAVDATSGDPLPGSGILTSPGAAGYYTGPPAQVPGRPGSYQRPGIAGDILVDSDGEFDVLVLKSPIDLTIEYFGYQSVTDQVIYFPPVGIGFTQTITRDYQLEASPTVSLSGAVRDSVTADTIEATVEILAISEKIGTPDSVLASIQTENGEFSVDLPANEAYQVTIRAEAPYPTLVIIVDDLDPAGQQLEVQLNPAQILIVNDDPNGERAEFLQQSFETLGMDYHTWVTADLGAPQMAEYNLFPDPRTVFWMTGSSVAEPLDSTDMQSLQSFLDSGGRLLLSGQNIAESDTGSTLIMDYFQVAFDRDYPPPIMRGVVDDPIGDGLIIQSSGGPGNQGDKDAFTLLGPDAVPAINYGPTGANGTSAVRIEKWEQDWKAVLMGFGIETINNEEGVRDQVISNILNWFKVPTGIEDNVTGISDAVPGSFALNQNYPNPFNPATTIRFQIQSQSKVTLTVFNSLGQQVRTLSNRTFSPGSYEVRWDGHDQGGREVSSGMYFYRLTSTAGFRDVKKMMLLR